MTETAIPESGGPNFIAFASNCQTTSLTRGLAEITAPPASVAPICLTLLLAKRREALHDLFDEPTQVDVLAGERDEILNLHVGAGIGEYAPRLRQGAAHPLVEGALVIGDAPVHDQPQIVLGDPDGIHQIVAENVAEQLQKAVRFLEARDVLPQIALGIVPGRDMIQTDALLQNPRRCSPNELND